MPEIMQSLATLACWKCGIAFAVPQPWVDKRIEDGRTFRCPNGHRNKFTKEGPGLAERQEIVAALHRAEQAEARAADAERRAREQYRPHPVTDLPPSPSAAGHPPPNPAGPVVIRSTGYRLCCPFCDKTYAHGQADHIWLRRHLLDAHRIDIRETGIEIVGADGAAA